MLSLVNPNYTPPTAYAIWVDPQFPQPSWASLLYQCIESLRGTGWERQLRQYGIAGVPTWAGMLEEFTTPQPKTVHFILPRSPGNVPGFMTEWLAYHSTMFGDCVISWNPYDSRLTLPQWLTGCTHELVEALTDAEVGQGWVNRAANNETADDCENAPSLSTSAYPGCISSYYSNALARCLVQGDM